ELAAWLVTGLMALCGALSFAELAGAIPETGGTYQFLKRAYPGTPIAFLFGWMMFFAYAASATAVTTSLAVENAGHFIGKFTEFTPAVSRTLTVAIILVFAVINCLGVREGGKTQNVLTILKVGGIVGVIVACFASGKGSVANFSPMLPEGRTVGQMTGSLGTAMILTVFSYSGWYFITHVAGEVREPQKTLPRAIFAGMGILILLYIAINAAYLYVLPFDRLANSPRVAAEAMQVVFGPRGADVISGVAFLSAIGAVNAQLLNYPRIPFSLASDGMFFRRLANIHPTRGTPVTAILVFAAIAATFGATGTYQENLTYVGFVGQLFMALTVFGLIVLRRREPDLPRPFRVPGYPWVPLLYVAILVWYLGNLLVNRLGYSLVGIGIVLAGIPFYVYWTRQRQGNSR
ncbi:MAG: amino acid permease, partial [Gemmatimonadetes bacterium]|nr:amino acid permease [Gemmatimonadota bacterium]